MECHGPKDFQSRGEREIIGTVSLSISLTFIFQLHIILNEHVHIKNGGLKIA